MKSGMHLMLGAKIRLISMRQISLSEISFREWFNCEFCIYLIFYLSCIFYSYFYQILGLRG